MNLQAVFAGHCALSFPRLAAVFGIQKAPQSEPQSFAEFLAKFRDTESPLSGSFRQEAKIFQGSCLRAGQKSQHDIVRALMLSKSAKFTGDFRSTTKHIFRISQGLARFTDLSPEDRSVASRVMRGEAERIYDEIKNWCGKIVLLHDPQYDCKFSNYFTGSRAKQMIHVAQLPGDQIKRDIEELDQSNSLGRYVYRILELHYRKSTESGNDITPKIIRELSEAVQISGFHTHLQWRLKYALFAQLTRIVLNSFSNRVDVGSQGDSLSRSHEWGNLVEEINSVGASSGFEFSDFRAMAALIGKTHEFNQLLSLSATFPIKP